MNFIHDVLKLSSIFLKMAMIRLHEKRYLLHFGEADVRFHFVIDLEYFLSTI